MLIIVKNKETLNMTGLQKFGLMWIFEPERMTADQERTMMESVVTWHKHFDYAKEAGKCLPCNGSGTRYLVDCPFCHAKGYMLSAVTEELFETFLNICWLMEKNEKGELEGRKALYKAHGIDYKKAFNLPGAHKPEDFHKAQLALEAAKKDHPEDYS